MVAERELAGAAANSEEVLRVTGIERGDFEDVLLCIKNGFPIWMLSRETE